MYLGPLCASHPELPALRGCAKVGRDERFGGSEFGEWTSQEVRSLSGLIAPVPTRIGALLTIFVANRDDVEEHIRSVLQLGKIAPYEVHYIPHRRSTGVDLEM